MMTSCSFHGGAGDDEDGAKDNGMLITPRPMPSQRIQGGYY